MFVAIKMTFNSIPPKNHDIVSIVVMIIHILLVHVSQEPHAWLFAVLVLLAIRFRFGHLVKERRFLRVEQIWHDKVPVLLEAIDVLV